jgi:hypothetical protein
MREIAGLTEVTVLIMVFTMHNVPPVAGGVLYGLWSNKRQGCVLCLFILRLFKTVKALASNIIVYVNCKQCLLHYSLHSSKVHG